MRRKNLKKEIGNMLIKADSVEVVPESVLLLAHLSARTYNINDTSS